MYNNTYDSNNLYKSKQLYIKVNNCILKTIKIKENKI